MLLPHSRLMQISLRNGDFIVNEFPEWLAETRGKSAKDFCGKPLESEVLAIIPGFDELLAKTIETGNPVKGYRVSFKDNKGKSHQLIIDTVLKKNPEKEDTVQVILQEIPEDFLSESALSEVSFCGLIGKSASMQKVFNKIRMYAVSEAPVLITGETGAGKEGVAVAVHSLSRRKNNAFVTMNCSAITETLFESELFGHEKGSFTGAFKNHRGRFERADGGTLFLDEIGDLPQLAQAKLLRALETSEIEKVGSERSVKVDVRLVAATNHDLERGSLENKFRADLYYRINALQIHLPALRERPEDIEPLIKHFIEVLNQKYQRNVVCLTREAIGLLKQYQWPGNVRELRNLMERLFAENQTEVIGLRALKEWYEERNAFSRQSSYERHKFDEVTILPYREPIPLGMNGNNNFDNAIAAEFTRKNNSNERVEVEAKPKGSPGKKELSEAFNMANGNITRAAELLGIHKATFYRHLKNLGLSRKDLESTG